MTRSRVSRAGASMTVIVVALALIGVLVALSIPGVERQSREVERGNYVHALAQLEMVKQQWVVAHKAADGAKVTLDDLRATSPALVNQVVFPESAKLEVGPVGVLPSCVYRGEKLTPLVDYKKFVLTQTD